MPVRQPPLRGRLTGGIVVQLDWREDARRREATGQPFARIVNAECSKVGREDATLLMKLGLRH
jgi:hypothetical protein